ncbi:MAG: hypothetical protein Kow00124_26980 [Anaerolineae bacterium]
MTAHSQLITPTARRALTAAAFLLAGALVVWLSPAEQTLGAAVKVVYVHVALSRAGAIGLLIAGLLGLATLITGRAGLWHWTAVIGGVALGIYAAGFAVSIIAQAVSWGGIAWREPRVAAALNGLAIGAIVVVLAGWAGQRRIGGLLYALLGSYITWSQITAADILHPGDAISTSTSAAIRFTGLALLVLALLAGAWIAREVGARPPETQPRLDD